MAYIKQGFVNFDPNHPLRAEQLIAMEDAIIALEQSAYSGKKLSIMGDSISTFKGYIPTGNSVYYTGTNCGVSKVEDTWWKKTMDALGMELCVNQSWSGSSVTNCKSSYGENSYGHTDYRTSRMHNDSGNPDVIIVYIGTNDLLTLSKDSVGSYDGSTDTIPTDITKFREAYAIMLNKIIKNYPNAKLYCCTLVANGTYNQNKNISKFTAFNQAIRDVATVFMAEIINLSACGINSHNLADYLGDGTLHPNAAGHSLIAKQVIKTLGGTARTRYINGGEGSIAYTVSSVDELPSDAPDGSLALVDETPTHIVRFYNNINIPETFWDNSFELNAFVFSPSLDKWVKINTIYFWDDGSGFSLYGDNDGIEEPYIVGDGWFAGSTWGVTNPPTNDSELMAWINNNSDGVRDGDIGVTLAYLYIRQNGEWVYEREAELGGSGSDGAITEVQTPEELDEILANATSSDVGKAYVFVGESNSKYKNGSIYIIREV